MVITAHSESSSLARSTSIGRNMGRQDISGREHREGLPASSGILKALVKCRYRLKGSSVVSRGNLLNDNK